MRKTIFWKAVLFYTVAAILSGVAGEAVAVSKPPTEFTLNENARYERDLPFKTDARDGEWVKRGFIARVAKDETEPLRITKGDGTIVWDMSRYAFISGDIKAPGQFPDTVNPSLWRQAILNANYGLYEVASRDFDGESRSIYQVRGYDLANMSFVETQNGFIVVDVTSYEESAAAAVKLMYDYLPENKKDKKIHTVIYTHSHVDHYGGVQGVLKSGKTNNDVKIVAPEGFWEAAVSENVTAGPAMTRRARWMYGFPLWRLGLPAGRGQVNNGLAIGSGTGTNDLAPPTMEIRENGSEFFDGLEVEFILTPHTEAPAEMVFYFRDYNSICLAEICNQTQHNVLTPRGAEVRDSKAWSEALAKMKKWADDGPSMELSAWGPHTWPRWGKDAVADYIGRQSELYGTLHDRTVDLMNEGFDMKEVAERFEFPPELAHEWFNRGYYGATVFNVKAVYQKYLGWFDNNPVSLWQLPDKISAAFYAKYLPQSGGSLVQAAQLAYDEGHYRWVVEVLDHVRLAPNAWDQSVYNAALELQADAFEQMAYSTESGIWRNYFLAGAWRNRDENIRDFLETPVAMSSVNARQIPGAHSARAAGSSKPPTEFTKRENAKYKGAPLDYSDTRDIGLIERGFIARVAKNATEPLLITKADGTVVWDMGRYSYISGDISKPEQFPDTVNPSLWRQAILNTHYGLYEIVSRDFGGEARSIYQVRGYDVANMSFIETPNGFIVVDALTNEEAAAAAVELLYDNLPENKKDKTIHTVIYTHSHTDHYGGIQGVLKSGKMRDGYEIAAPEGFWEAAVSENETVGPAMLSRAKWMYGQALWMIDIPDGRGQVNNGLAISTSFGTNELKAPTQVIAGDGARQFDGTNVEFILTPDTEAPAEMVMLFTDYNSICLAEICNQTQHNILTPRGAQVRDTLAWSGTLDKMKREWVDTGRADSAWGPHNWPRWGKDAVGEYIDKQSRLYRFLHDQTVVLMNEGYDMKEIAERFELPPELAKEWFNRGYYGATVFNVKAVHQKYLGWFDNNPVSLWKLPDKISAEFYAKYLPQSGGNLVQAAQAAYADGNYRWVAEVLDHVCLAPGNWDQSVYNAALELQADAFEQMAYSAESGIWRNYFLTGAWRNRDEEFRKLIDDGDDGGGNTGGDGGCQTGLGLGALLLIAALIFPRLKKTK